MLGCAYIRRNSYNLVVEIPLVNTSSTITTRFHNFTDENILSVCDSAFVGNFFTDDIPDRKRLSAFLSSVISHSVAKSVGRKNICRWFYRRKLHQKIFYSKKSFSLEIYWRISSVGDCVKYRWNKSLVTLSVSVWNTDRRYPSVYSSVIVVAFQKCWGTNSN